MAATQVFYEGRVQGVGFRWTVRSIAKGFDVTGVVLNLPDGRVELQAAGEPQEVEEFLEAVRESPLAGHILKEERCALVPAPSFKGFQIVG